MDDVSLVTLDFSDGHENNVADIDPNPILHLATDVAKSLFLVSTHDENPRIAEHLGHLTINLSVLSKQYLSLLVEGCVLCSLTLVATFTS